MEPQIGENSTGYPRKFVIQKHAEQIVGLINSMGLMTLMIINYKMC